MRLPVSAALLLCLEPAWAAAPSRASFDLYVFSQSDNGGGDPYRAEGFVNTGMREEVRLQTSEQVALFENATLAILNNSAPEPLPSTIANANVLAASGTVVYLETSIGAEWTSADGAWTVRPSLYYHHQSAIIAGGADLALSWLLGGGDTTLMLSYGFRLGFRRLHYWDGTIENDHSHPTPSHTLLVGWVQTLSPSLRVALNLVFARQTGILSNTFGFVTVFDTAGLPRLLVDERLPTERNRIQLNGRLRFAVPGGPTLGLDGSIYADDWDVRVAAIEPSLEAELSEGVRARVWARISAQEGARYLTLLPSTLEAFRTQDSDLGSFTMFSPGLELSAPLPAWASLTWRLRVGAFGFFRTDGLFAITGHSGVTTTW
ncbi:MAG: DUF3570 domain-containing protein [Myxococcota bacterium]